MKKHLTLTGLIAALVGASSISAQAAFTSKQQVQVTAQATVGGTPTASFTLTLRPTSNMLTGAAAGAITWGAVTPINPGTGWTMADTGMDLSYTMNDADGGIQIYTDNTNNAPPTGQLAANPRFADPTAALPMNADSNPAGLLLFDPAVGGQQSTSLTLPVAWTAKVVPAVLSGTPDLGVADPNTGPSTGVNNRFQWLFMLDRQTPPIDRNGDGSITLPPPGSAFNPLNDSAGFGGKTALPLDIAFDPYAKVIGIGGVHSDGGTSYAVDADHRAFVYFESDFTTAAAASSYRTNRLIVEAYIQ